MKSEIRTNKDFNLGDLVYWFDFWTQTKGIGLVINFKEKYNTPCFSKGKSENPMWVLVLDTSTEKNKIISFPPSFIGKCSRYSSYENFYNNIVI